MTVTPDDVYNVRFPKARRREPGYDEYEVDVFLDRIEATLRGEDTVTAQEILSIELRGRQRGQRAYRESAVDAFLDDCARTLMRREQVRDAAVSTLRKVGAQRQPSTPVEPDDPDDVVSSWGETPRSATGQAIPPARRPETSAPMRAREQPVATHHDSGSEGMHNVSFIPTPDEPACDAVEVDALISRVEATLRGEDDLTAQQIMATRFSSPPPGHPGYAEAGVREFLGVLASSLGQLRPSHATSTVPRIPAPAPQDTTDPDPATDATLSRFGLGAAFQARQHSGGAHALKTPPTPNRRAPGHYMSADEIHHVTLGSPPPGELGYDVDDVDYFLDLVEATFRGEARLTVADVRAVRFRESPAEFGAYATNEVEELVEVVEAQITYLSAQPRHA